MERPRAALAFSLLARLWIVLVATITVLGAVYFEPDRWQTALEIVILLGAEVVVAMQLLPLLLLAGTSGQLGRPAGSANAIVAVAHLADSRGARSDGFRAANFRRRTERAGGRAAGDRSAGGRGHGGRNYRAGRGAANRAGDRIRRQASARRDDAAARRGRHLIQSDARRTPQARGRDQTVSAAGVRKNDGRHRGHRGGAGHAGSSRPRRGDAAPCAS